METKHRFTQDWVEGLPFAGAELPRQEFRDADCPGLVLRVGLATKTYYLFRRTAAEGRRGEQKIKLGDAAAITPQRARALAKSDLRRFRRERGSLVAPDPVRLDDEMLTTKEAAALTRLSCAWFERKRWEGAGPPYYRTGRSIRYMKRELLAWWQLHREA